MTSWRTNRMRFGEQGKRASPSRREAAPPPCQWIEAVLDELIQTNEEWSQFHRQTSIEHEASPTA